MKQKFIVTGMTCSACSAHVEKAVRKLPGIRQADVNLLGGKRYGQMTIERPAREEDARTLIETLTKEGVVVQEVSL